jgi:hypothetical protein
VTRTLYQLGRRWAWHARCLFENNDATNNAVITACNQLSKLISTYQATHT